MKQHHICLDNSIIQLFDDYGSIQNKGKIFINATDHNV